MKARQINILTAIVNNSKLIAKWKMSFHHQQVFGPAIFDRLKKYLPSTTNHTESESHRRASTPPPGFAVGNAKRSACSENAKALKFALLRK